MNTSLPLGYTILVRSHAKCYSILTRASKGLNYQKKKKKKKERKAMSFRTMLHHRFFTSTKHHKSSPNHSTSHTKTNHSAVSWFGMGHKVAKEFNNIIMIITMRPPTVEWPVTVQWQTKPHCWAWVINKKGLLTFFLFFFSFFVCLFIVSI